VEKITNDQYKTTGQAIAKCHRSRLKSMRNPNSLVIQIITEMKRSIFTNWNYFSEIVTTTLNKVLEYEIHEPYWNIK